MTIAASVQRPVGGWLLARWIATAALLAAPAIAMLYTPEVRWTAFDFAVAAALLVGAGLAYDLLAPHLASRCARVVAGGVIAAVLVLVWLQGAVGIV